jgi:hypothetical protein
MRMRIAGSGCMVGHPDTSAQLRALVVSYVYVRQLAFSKVISGDL